MVSNIKTLDQFYSNEFYIEKFGFIKFSELKNNKIKGGNSFVKSEAVKIEAEKICKNNDGKITLYSNEYYVGTLFKHGGYWDEDTLLNLKSKDPMFDTKVIVGNMST